MLVYHSISELECHDKHKTIQCDNNHYEYRIMARVDTEIYIPKWITMQWLIPWYWDREAELYTGCEIDNLDIRYDDLMDIFNMVEVGEEC